MITEFGGIGGDCQLQGNGATQSATCCTISKEGWMRRLGRRGLRMLAAFWTEILVEVTQETGVVPCCRHAAIGTHFCNIINHARKRCNDDMINLLLLIR